MASHEINILLVGHIGAIIVGPSDDILVRVIDSMVFADILSNCIHHVTSLVGRANTVLTYEVSIKFTT